MCNEVARRIALNLIREDFSHLKIPLRFPEGIPNLPATESIRITDPAPIIRAGPAHAEPEAEMVQRRWSWPGPSGKPVYNYRSEGRRLANTASAGRCLIPVDGFYEFTAPDDPKAKRKDKWHFTLPDAALFCIAGLWRADPQVGEAFTMFTCDAGPDIATFHPRQIVIMPRQHWAGWLNGVEGLIAPTPAGTLVVERV